MSRQAMLREPDAQPQALGALLTGDLPAALAGLNVSGVNQDSRLIEKGDLFLACQGVDGHGLSYLPQARERGATAVAFEPAAGVTAPGDYPAIAVEGLGAHAGEIAARFYGEPARQMFVVGITGTDGKTSCAWILAQALDRLGAPCGYMGTIGYGFVDALDSASHTTPDAVRMQYWLAKLRANGAGAVAMEVSSHALTQGRVSGVDFDMAVLTNLGRDHLDYHGDELSYAQAKRRLFDMPGLRAAILNQDDVWGRRWLAELPAGVAGIAYGMNDQPAAAAARHLLAVDIQPGSQGLLIDIDGSWGRASLQSRLLGRFNAWNLLACLAVLLEQGYGIKDAVAALSLVPTVPGRMQAITGHADQPLVVVDYAHTPQALSSALAALRDHCAGRLICVFGCGGDRDRGKRPLMAAAAASGAERLIITDDNPRSEDPAAIVKDMLSGLPADANFHVEHDRAAAIAQAVAEAQAGDVVLIAGKGHEDYQLIGEERRPFSDRQLAEKLLRGQS